MLAGLDDAVFDGLDNACDPTYDNGGVIVGDDYFGDYKDVEGELDAHAVCSLFHTNSA